MRDRRTEITICRICKTLPSDLLPGAGLHPYFLTKLIPHRVLLISRCQEGRLRSFAAHVVHHAVPYRSVAFTDTVGCSFYSEKHVSPVRWIRAYLRLAWKLQESVFWIKAIRQIVAFKPRIVHVHSVLFAPIGVLSKILVRARYVITLHNAFELDQVIRFPFLSQLITNADAVLAVSDDIIRKGRRLFPSTRFLLTPSGVDLGQFRDLGLHRDEQIICVARLSKQKRHDVLLRAFAEIARERPRARLLLIGTGPEGPVISQDIIELRLVDRVHVLHSASQDDLCKFNNESRVFALASDYEGMPKAALEAMACGTPAVLTDGCGLPEADGVAGLVVKRGDIQGLARSMRLIIENDTLWKRLSYGAQSLAGQHAWERTAQSVSSAYGVILRQRPV